MRHPLRMLRMDEVEIYQIDAHVNDIVAELNAGVSDVNDMTVENTTDERNDDDVAVSPPSSRRPSPSAEVADPPSVGHYRAPPPPSLVPPAEFNKRSR